MIKGTGHLFQTDVLSLAPLEFKMWSERNPSSEVVELYELANKVVMEWLKKYGFDDIQITAHTQIDEYYEKTYIKVLNKPQENSTAETIQDEAEEEEAK
mmetsp:Transcript_26287/g.30405  ORF Transcript_26287/g.30405 Transcript_26287/m.30405 type:complete len:99 (-) Transcript_26287:40-336(-)